MLRCELRGEQAPVTFVVSSDRANTAAARLGLGVVTLVPVTRSNARVCAFQALLPAAETGLRMDSKAQAEEVRAVAVEHIGAVRGRVPAPVMGALSALRLHLQLDQQAIGFGR